MLTYIPSAGAEPFAGTFPLITDLSKTGSQRAFTLTGSRKAGVMERALRRQLEDLSS